jgi:hypothetical protein
LKYDHDDTHLAAAFAAVRQYDPATYARMEADTAWHVSTDPFTDLFDFDFTMVLVAGGEQTLESDGMTVPQGVYPYAMTWINGALIGYEAESEGISDVLDMASALVHEYAHTHVHYGGHNEPEAFRAASAFAELLPSPDGALIKRDSDETLAYALAHPEQYPNTLSD